jgi:geranylgeranyl diphosphate synthase, type II
VKADLGGFESYLSQILKSEVLPITPRLNRFWEGMEYSLFGGGKRFRPMLCLLTAQALGKGDDEALVYPWASAIEMIHTYSLIHDDLPCLDNDDERRGRATHHKVFGEDMALLSGDALQSLAFFTVAEEYQKLPALGMLIKELARASGVQGMVGGQVLDMLADIQQPDASELELIHRLKTGALISASVYGAGLVYQATESELSALRNFGDHLGLAFQIADDIDDAREGETQKNYVGFFGEEKALRYLSEISSKARQALESLKHNTSGLETLIEFNQTRVKT